MIVPASKSVRLSRIHNVDTDRLLRHFDYLRANGAAIARKADGHSGSGRGTLAQTAKELLTLQHELHLRTAGVLPEVSTRPTRVVV